MDRFIAYALIGSALDEVVANPSLDRKSVV